MARPEPMSGEENEMNPPENPTKMYDRNDARMPKYFGVLVSIIKNTLECTVIANGNDIARDHVYILEKDGNLCLFSPRHCVPALRDEMIYKVASRTVGDAYNEILKGEAVPFNQPYVSFEKCLQAISQCLESRWCPICKSTPVDVSAYPPESKSQVPCDECLEQMKFGDI